MSKYAMNGAIVTIKELCLAVFVLWATESLAEIPGTALSNDRDLIRFDLTGGVASPGAGVSGGGTGLWTIKRTEAIGLSSNFALHSISGDKSRLTTISHDVVWEHSIALFEGFHAFRLRGGLGAARVHRTMDQVKAREQGQSTDKVAWAPHASASAALDFPMADLMWLRIGVWGGQAFLKEIPAQSGIFASWVFGGQWVGIGD
jgi:hypothetical protein